MRLVFGCSLILITGCFSYNAELVSSEPKTPGEVLEDPSDLTDPSGAEDTPAEPSSPSDPNDGSDESFDDWADESDPVTSDCTYQCTEDGLFCDYDNCDECTGGTECCPCDGGELNSTCTNGDKTVLYCTDGCWEAENCGLGEVCSQIFENIAACEPCTPCSEAGQVYCDVVGNRESMYVCTENFCLVEERCPPGDTCMYDRRPFMNDFSGVCRSTFFGCEEEFCGGFLFCDEGDFRGCGPCGCCDFNDFNNGRDLCAAGPDGTYVLEGVNRLACYDPEFCGPNEMCQLTPNGEAGYCRDIFE